MLVINVIPSFFRKALGTNGGYITIWLWACDSWRASCSLIPLYLKGYTPKASMSCMYLQIKKYDVYIHMYLHNKMIIGEYIYIYIVHLLKQYVHSFIWYICIHFIHIYMFICTHLHLHSSKIAMPTSRSIGLSVFSRLDSNCVNPAEPTSHAWVSGSLGDLHPGFGLEDWLKALDI